MAYKSQYRLSPRYYSDSKKELETEVKNQIEQYIEDNDDLSWVISEGLNEWGEDDRSFQNKNEIMTELSKKFFYIIFILEYDPLSDFEMGETREYWYQGEVQVEYAEIKIEDFNHNKLRKLEID